MVSQSFFLFREKDLKHWVENIPEKLLSKLCMYLNQLSHLVFRQVYIWNQGGTRDDFCTGELLLCMAARLGYSRIHWWKPRTQFTVFLDTPLICFSKTDQIKERIRSHLSEALFQNDTHLHRLLRFCETMVVLAITDTYHHHMIGGIDIEEANEWIKQSIVNWCFESEPTSPEILLCEYTESIYTKLLPRNFVPLGEFEKGMDLYQHHLPDLDLSVSFESKEIIIPKNKNTKRKKKKE